MWYRFLIFVLLYLNFSLIQRLLWRVKEICRKFTPPCLYKSLFRPSDSFLLSLQGSFSSKRPDSWIDGCAHALNGLTIDPSTRSHQQLKCICKPTSPTRPRLVVCGLSGIQDITHKRKSKSSETEIADSRKG